MKYLFILAFFLLIPQFGISQSVADQVPHYPEPNIPITNSLIVSELALKKNGVDPKKYFVREATWVTSIKIPTYEVEELRPLFEQFGEGPFWHVIYALHGWKPTDGGYARPALSVFVFDAARAAVVK